MRLTSWLKNVQSKALSRRRRLPDRCGWIAAAEMLETRALLAATITLNTATKELLVTGTTLDDTTTVEPVTATTFKVHVVTGESAVEQTFALSAVNKITFNAGAGNDSLTDTTDRPVSMTGGDGNDTLLGGTGDDTLDGGANDDSVDGGAGNDLLIASADADFVLTDLLLTGQGNDSLFGMERVQITGGGSANLITAPTATLRLTAFGGGGNDSILGGLGNDTLDGGDGNDTLNGYGANDTVVGGPGNDWVQGGSGVDWCDGGSGDDRVEGLGSSGDTLRGGLGNDTLDGGVGTGDIFSEVGNVNFTLSASVVSGVMTGQLNGLGIDTLLNLEGAQLTGGVGANRLDASAWGLPSTLTGGLGNDTLVGGTGLDLLSESGNVNFKLTDLQLTGVGTDSLSGIDQAILTGGDGANLIDASAATKPVTLNGGASNDTLKGGFAADRMDGGDGNDWITGGLGADTIIGQAGTDRLVESGDTDFTLTNASLIGAQADKLFTLEEAQLTGGPAANSITIGNFPGPVTLNGAGGNDTLEGSSFGDRLDGGTGNDVLNGKDGNDTLMSGDGNDTLLGAAGNDSLDGGNGSDIVLGDFGNDTLLGGYGRDFLIGDAGTDSLNGGPDDDLVLGSSYKYDTDLAALAHVLSDWSSTATYLNRVSTLQNTSHPYFLKSMAQITDNATLYDDYCKDTVVGGLGSDLFLRPGQPGTITLDVTPDRLSTETMNVSTFGTANPGYFPTNMTKPGYLSTLNDPTFGTPITRVTGDAGALLTIPVNTGGTTSLYWSGNVRTRYVTDSNWNIDGSLMMLRSYDPAMRYQLVLNGMTYQPLFFADIPSTNFRWSQDPAKPNIQYAFPQANVLDATITNEGTSAPLPLPGPDDDKIIQYDVTTGQVLNTITLPFNKLYSPKVSIGLVNGHEYAALLGVDKLNPSVSNISVYVVALNPSAGQSPVVASMLLTTADSGTPEADYATALDFSNLRFSPDGQHILALYNGSTVNTRSWRLLDVDYADGTIRSHVMPNLTADDTFQTNGDPTQGHFPVNWSHPVFAFGPTGTDVYVVGVSGQFNKRTFPENEITTANGLVGSVLAFNVTNNTFHSLTDPANENQATHITATNTQHSGYVFVSYGNDVSNGRGTKYAGEIIAINLVDPFGANGTIELVHHRTNIANNDYYALPLPTVSPDGTKLIFSSTWGTLQSVVQSFVLDLSGMVP